MGTIKINDIVYGSNNASEIIYKSQTVEEKLDTIPIFDIESNENSDIDINNYLTSDNITNDLTSTDINKALSANQGKILKESIDALNAAYQDDSVNMNKDIDVINTKVTTNTTNITSLTNWKNKYLNTYHPVGSIYITSTNKAPTIGGTWSLVDKEFTPFYNSSTANGTFFTINSTNTTSHSTAVMREGHTLRIRCAFVNKVALADSTLAIGTFKLADLGVSGNLVYTVYVNGRSDGGNTMHQMQLIYDTGVLNHYDIVGADSVAAGKTIQFDITIPVRYNQMADANCNKFYWKRTA